MRRPARAHTRRRRYDREPIRRVLGRGAVVAGLVIALSLLAISTYDGVPGRSYDEVTASVPRTGNLISHDPVRIAGRRVGQVKSVTSGRDGNALIRLQLEKGNPLPVDSRILLRANGLLGARYVELVPGHSRRLLAAGTVIRGGDASLTFGATEALDVLDRQTRGGLHTTLGELGKGMLGQGRPLNDAIRRGAPAIGSFNRLVRLLNRQRGAQRRLLPSLDSLARSLDAPRVNLGRLFGRGAAALRPFVERRGAVRDALSAAPPAFEAAQTGLRDGTVLLRAAEQLAGAAPATLASAPSALRASTALLRESSVPLARTGALLKDVDATVPPVLRLTRAANPVLEPLHGLLGTLDPIVNELGRHGCDIENMAAVFRSMTGFGGGPEGPVGPAMEFRLQVAAPLLSEATGTTDTSGLAFREGYPAPCKFLSRPYASIQVPAQKDPTP
ncbi:MAG: Mammalian cell entry related domain protein [Solirubrobacterales bacterium]|nr:Mammalian cell entry related domain protein [Solirubrobacterales bacterium]